MPMRHHTSGSAGSVITLPMMAVKPHSRTQKWIWRWALRAGVMGMAESVAERVGYKRATLGI